MEWTRKGALDGGINLCSVCCILGSRRGAAGAVCPIVGDSGSESICSFWSLPSEKLPVSILSAVSDQSPLQSYQLHPAQRYVCPLRTGGTECPDESNASRVLLPALLPLFQEPGIPVFTRTVLTQWKSSGLQFPLQRQCWLPHWRWSLIILVTSGWYVPEAEITADGGAARTGWCHLHRQGETWAVAGPPLSSPVPGVLGSSTDVLWKGASCCQVGWRSVCCVGYSLKWGKNVARGSIRRKRKKCVHCVIIAFHSKASRLLVPFEGGHLEGLAGTCGCIFGYGEAALEETHNLGFGLGAPCSGLSNSAAT